MRFTVGLVVLLASSSVLADRQLEQLLVGDRDAKPPRFAITDKSFYVAPKTTAEVSDVLGLEEYMPAFEVDAKSGDKRARWSAADLVPFAIGCGADPCPPEPPPEPAEWHATTLYDLGGKEPQVVVWHIARVVSAKDQKAALEKGTVPPAMPKKIDGAEDLVKVFESTIGDPKALAKTVSGRKDVVLYGNEARERTVGGAKVRAKLQRWNLAFRVRDGIQAGLTSSKTVGWVAANVDAKSLKRPKDKPVPYRLLFLYEKTGTSWKLVSAHFSFVE